MAASMAQGQAPIEKRESKAEEEISWCGFGRNCCKYVSSMLWTRRQLLLALAGGQFLSLMLAGTGVSSQLLESKYSIAVPTTQLFMNYFLLGVVFGTLLACRKNFLAILRKNWWKYLILGVTDVEANYVVVLAYKYTTLTSIQLLDSFTIVCVMILSFVFLRVRYQIIHLMGVALCIIGIFSLVVADLRGPRDFGGSIPILGDLLCIIGAMLYAVNNVAQEYLVKNHGIVEYLALLGVVGAFVSGIQLSILERVDLASIEFSFDIVLLFVVFWCSMFLLYTFMTIVMKLSNAVVVNLSLLTADFYTLLFGIFLFHYHFSIFYLMAFTLIIIGVFIFNLKIPSVAKLKDKGLRQKRLLTLKWPRTKTSHAVLSNLQDNTEHGDNSQHKGILRGPNEAVLSSVSSIKTSYAQSKSYGSNSSDGSEFLHRWSQGEIFDEANEGKGRVKEVEK